MSSLKLYGSTSGYVEVAPEATAQNNSITIPNTAGTIAVKDASGNLGIGSDSPTEKLDVVQDAADNIVAQFRNVNTNSGNLLKFTQLTNGSVTNPIFYVGQGGDNSGNAILLNNANTDMVFSTNNTEAARFTAAGNLQFPNGQGIDFSLTTDGTGTPSSDLLDDYEEGTFTPTVSSTSVNVSYSGQEGYYTKVGNMVHFSFQININGVTSNGSGDFTMSGIPYSASNSAGRYVIQTSSVNFDSTGYDHYSYLGSATTLKVLKGNDNSSWSVVQVADFSLTSGSIITVLGTYRTAT